MRSFIAINPTDEIRSRLYRATEPLRSASLPVRWVAEESVHLTLKFLGDVKDDRRDGVIEKVTAVARRFEPFEMRVHGLGAFPSLRRPRVLWAGVEQTPPLMEMQAALEDELEALGFRKEKRAYHPHVTLGRSRERGAHPAYDGLGRLFEAIEFDERFEVRTVDLMKSTLSPRGARYELVRACGL